ncbi:MAG: ornithine carbamoyltransferase [Terriglobales bacterium]
MVTARTALAGLQQQNLISIQDLSPYEVEEIFELTRRIKARPAAYSRALAGKQFMMIFEKPSLRTRVTFEVGINSLGGHALFMEQTAGIAKREKVADVGRNLERWVQGIILRTFKHTTVAEMAANTSVPVINALTDKEHPCQALADYFTLAEKFGDLKPRKLAFVGDGNNVAHSLMLTAANLGSKIAVATPKGYEPAKDVVQAAQRIAKRTAATIEITHDAKAAVAGADAVYTDVWASMGQESEAQSRDMIFRPYQVNSELMSLAAPHAVFMHCLPAHRGDEVTDQVLDSAQSVVYDEAENRLHVQNAILVMLAGTTKGLPVGTVKTATAVRTARA